MSSETQIEQLALMSGVGMAEGTEEKLKLMVVDDEPDNLALLFRTFRRDFEVVKAESAIAALKLLDQQGEMAIIISDQRMPEMLGTEFLSQTVNRFPDTIRIVLTGYTDVEDLVEAINAGKVFKYITKPWIPDQLKVVVQQAAETYQLVKQRTNILQHALRRESLFNAVTTAIRESLDYQNMLQTIAATLGQTFSASQCLLQPVEGDRLEPEVFYYPIPETTDLEVRHLTSTDPVIEQVLTSRQSQVTSTLENQQRLVVPLIYQQDFLAVLVMDRDIFSNTWLTEDIELIQEVAEQAALAISQARLYLRSQKQAEQMRAELEVARQIQGNLLRQSLPELEGMRVQACCYPAREVGGDFFEVYSHPQGDLWLAVGDVSGKGVPAALFMASAISVLRRELSQELPPDPDEVMRNLNRSLSDDLISTNYFITLVLVRYTPASQKLVYANAGHIYPLVWSQAAIAHHQVNPSQAIDLEPIYLKVRGVPLGILPDWKAQAGTLDLKPGEVLLLTSDGITEATIHTSENSHASAEQSPARSMLQQTGLWQLLLSEQQPLNLAHMLARIRSQNQVQEDDQTILSLEVL